MSGAKSSVDGAIEPRRGLIVTADTMPYYPKVGATAGMEKSFAQVSFHLHI